MIREEAFKASRQRDWDRLAMLCQMAEGSTRELSDAEFLELVRLYRQASGDLAYLTTNSSNPDALAWLNQVVGRAYGQIHRHPSKPFGEALYGAIASGADAIRRNYRYLVFATVWFFLCSFLAYGLCAANPELRTILNPPEMAENTAHWKAGKHEPKESSGAGLMSAFYASNNPRVAIMQNALSLVTLGAFGFYSMWINAANVGSLAYEVSTVGKLGFLLISLFPHGVSEIGGIFVSFAASLRCLVAVLNPGPLKRLHALKIAGGDAMKMMGVSLVMIFFAAPIEAYFSFNGSVPDWARLMMGIATLAGWLFYFIGFGRSAPISTGETGLRPAQT